MRERAIAVALAHIRRHGFAKVRLIDVAREMGLSHAALYTHFIDKAALFDAVSERWLEETRLALDAVCAAAGDPRSRIEAWFVTLYTLKRARVLRDPELYRAFDAAAALRKPFVVEHFAAVQRQLSALIAAVSTDPDRDAQLLCEAMASFHHPKLVVEHADEDREPLLRALLKTLLAGLGLSAD